MPILLTDLLTDFALVQSYASVQFTRNQLGDNEWKYIVVDLGNGQYSAFQLAHLIEKLMAWKGAKLTADVQQAQLDKVPGLLPSTTTKAIDIDGPMTLPQAKKQAITLPLKLLVALQKGQVVGVIHPNPDVRSADIPKVDTAWLPVGEVESATGVLIKDSGVSPDTETPQKPIEPRFMNVELLNEDYDRLDPKAQPLTKSTNYNLAFFVDSKIASTSIAGTVGDIGTAIFQGNEDEVVLTIQLESNDFVINNKVQNLRVPRTGKSPKVRFDIQPQADGPAAINAVILKDGAFIQVITLNFFVGELFKAEVKGREINEAPKLLPRDLNLTILQVGDGFQMIMSGPTAAIAKIPLDKRQLSKMVGKLRKTLLEVVHLETSGVRIYQTRWEIPAAISQHTLPILANAGYDLFDQLFYGPGHDLQANQLGDTFKKMAKKDRLKIQIFSQEFTLPWGLLYLGDDPDNPEPEMFLGLKHIIEHIPLQPKMQVTERVIETQNGLAVALNVNTDIDAQMGSAIIGRQIEYWQKISQSSPAVKVQVRNQAQDVVDGLNDGETKDDILYFYCHAESYNLDEMDKGGPDLSKLIMTGHQELTLRKISRNKNSLAGKPLVFINACESAELSPEFYDGFVPYFVSKGARGVIGTECETPALFAEEWANRFFKKFLAGQQPLGEIFLDLRREFFFNHHNIMGLLYALYVDGDTIMSQPVVNG